MKFSAQIFKTENIGTLYTLFIPYKMLFLPGLEM